MIDILSSVQMILGAAQAEALGVIAVLLLIALLVVKELVSTLEDPWQTLGRYLNVAILPLLITFCVMVALRVADVLAQ